MLNKSELNRQKDIKKKLNYLIHFKRNFKENIVVKNWDNFSEQTKEELISLNSLLGEWYSDCEETRTK